MTSPLARMSASVTLLWMRPDLPRAQAMDYWRGPHSQLVARTPGFLEYRQHHFTADSTGLWPAVDGVETAIPDHRRIDGAPEVTFSGALAPVKGLLHNRKIQADERNVFGRTVLHVTGGGGARWAPNDPTAAVGFRTFVLLRARDGVDRRAFADFVNEYLAPLLAGRPDLLEVRSHAFKPWNKALWNTPDVAHDYPPENQFHGCLILGARDRASLLNALTSAAVRATMPEQARNLAAVHAYEVAATYVYRRDNRPTLPQTSSAKKPALAPVRRVVPPAPDRARSTTGADPFPPAELVVLDGHGPEDVVVDQEGRLLCGLEGGRILRIDRGTGTSTVIGDTGGRPLGLDVAPDGRVLICDAHRGLLRLDPTTGDIETLVQYVDGVPLRFCSNATAAADGTIWFTEASTRFDYEHFLGAFLEHRGSGRLLRRDPDGRVEVVLDGLHFANGITLTPDESALLYAETAAHRISRLPLSGPDAGTPTVLADNLPGSPDNMSRFTDGRTWVAMAGPRAPSLDKLGVQPNWVAKVLWALPARFLAGPPASPWVMAFDEDGTVLADLQEPRDDFSRTTGVAAVDGELFCASPDHGALLRIHARTATP